MVHSGAAQVVAQFKKRAFPHVSKLLHIWTIYQKQSIFLFCFRNMNKVNDNIPCQSKEQCFGCMEGTQWGQRVTQPWERTDKDKQDPELWVTELEESGRSGHSLGKHWESPEDCTRGQTQD